MRIARLVSLGVSADKLAGCGWLAGMSLAGILNYEFNSVRGFKNLSRTRTRTYVCERNRGFLKISFTKGLILIVLKMTQGIYSSYTLTKESRVERSIQSETFGMFEIKSFSPGDAFHQYLDSAVASLCFSLFRWPERAQYCSVGMEQ